jgi:glycosyltransferase involved in cell wall biosynthesis
MNRLLLVSYYYPPVAGAGVFRPLRMSKYLRSFGWDVTVLAITDRARLLKDPSLVDEIPLDVRVERTRSFEPRTFLIGLNKLRLGGLVRRVGPWLNLPDEQRGWVPFARRRALSVLREQEHHAIVSTSSPYSAHLVGLELHRMTGLPWVADFRDEWTTNPYLSYPTAWHRRVNERLEREVLMDADRVVCVSTPWLDNLRGLVPDAPASKFVTLPNGYDGEHFAEPPLGPPDRFRVVYTGMFYGHRSPRVFLEALDRVLRDRRITANDLEVSLVGHTADAEGLASLPGGLVRIVEQRPYRETLRYLQEAAALLLVIPTAGGAGNHTGKLFPYLASGRPILCLAPEPNVAADLIRQTRSGEVVSPEDPAQVADALARLYQRWKEGRSLPDQDRGMIGRYEAHLQTHHYAKLLDRLVSRG